jgi:hypothetical protein
MAEISTKRFTIIFPSMTTVQEAIKMIQGTARRDPFELEQADDERIA